MDFRQQLLFFLVKQSHGGARLSEHLGLVRVYSILSSVEMSEVMGSREHDGREETSWTQDYSQQIQGWPVDVSLSPASVHHSAHFSGFLGEYHFPSGYPDGHSQMAAFVTDHSRSSRSPQ